MVESPATLLASSKHSLIDLFNERPYARAPLNASPAPVVSTLSTGLALI